MGKRCKGKGALLLILLLGVSLPVFLLSCNGGGGGGNSAPVTVADFSASPTNGDAPLTVMFTDNSTGGPTTWAWDFGDGGTSALQNPSHTYVTAGTYTVSLYLDGPGGLDNVTKAGYITVNPAAQFSASPTTGPVPLTVAFTDLSTGGPTSWAWDFGDGGTSTAQNPSHDYVTGGTYTVTLATDGPGGLDSETKTGYISVTPLAEFSATPTDGILPLTVAFTDLSTGATSWDWDFGDNTTSTVQDPSHTYTAEGSYTVSLLATGPGGSHTNTKPNYITVGPIPPAPVAGFSGTPTTGAATLTVPFTNLTTGAVSTWSWDFGDGGTSTMSNPSHDYVTSGIYTVSLTATGPGGSDTFTETDYISVTPLAEFSATPTTGTAPLDVTFTDNSTGGATSWFWDFGDGGTSTLQNPSHQYDNVSGGNYTVSLTATGPGGDNTITKPNYISTAPVPAPVAGFSATPLTGLVPLTVTFTDESTGAVSTYAWEFGDAGNSTSTQQNPSFTYTAAGTYTVALTVTGPGGSDPETKVGYITVAPGVFTDDFNRADENPLGGNWTTAPGCGDLQLSSNEVVGDNTISCAYWNANPFNPDQYSEITVAFFRDSMGPAVRIQTGGVTRNGYFAKIDNTTQLSIKLNENDSASSLLPDFTVAPLQATDTIRLQVVDNTLTLFVNGVSQGTRTDATFASGVPGIWSFYTNGALDDWEGGSIDMVP